MGGRSRWSFWMVFCLWGMVSLCVFPKHLCAQTEVELSIADSLSHLLQQKETPHEKIPVLKKLLNLYWQQPEEVMYMEKIIDFSIQADSFHVVYEAMAGLCRYYLNDKQFDSLLIWKERLDALSIKRKEAPIALFRVTNLMSKNYLTEKNYELAMSEAIRQFNRAKETNNEYGMMSANLNQALVYQSVRRDEDAMKVFREGLKWINANLNRPSFKLQFLSEMLVSSLRLDNYEESLSLLRLYESIFKEEERSFTKKRQVFPMWWHRWYIDSFYARLYTKSGQLKKAQAHLEKAALASADSTDEEMKALYYKVAALYYQETKENTLALRMIDKALRVDSDLVVLKQKVDVLKSDGRIGEALVLYDDLLERNSLVSNEAFLRQMTQLQELNDINEGYKRASELSHQNKQIKGNQRLFILTVLFALMLLASLYFLYRYYRHTCFFKNKLQDEKDALVKSGKELQLMKEIAEEADRKKTAFIANISHEVRTPLNAIVGFSELLAEGSWEVEDKEEFSSTINKNGEILMNLINDVLDLSRLESGNTQFALTPLEIVACCKDMLDDSRKRVSAGIEVTFNSPLEAYELNTDPYRFKQLIGKLLLNATKFTQEGEINLSYEIDKEQDVIRFLIADTGCGIPLDQQSLVFERFEKLDDFVQGTGLGLPICQMIAQKIGGSLIVDPDYTKGARFIFTHPIN